MANIKDFATTIIHTAPSPATTGTSLVLVTGMGARMPATPFDAVAHPEGELPTLDNAEKVTVTAVSADTLTITRAQGDTAAKSIEAGWRLSNAIFSDSFATTAQGALADSALQSADIANFETTTQLNSRDTANRNTDNHVSGTTNKVYTATEQTKLSGIEAGADVTDSTNVAAAGAVMDGDFSSNGLMQRTGAGTYSVKGVPTGDVVGTSDTQTLTNKTISGSSNTLSNIVATTALTATGTKSSSTYLRGDNTWATPPDTMYSEISTAEIDAGTGSTSRTITGRRVDYIQDKTLERAYPVGSIYISTISTNPNTLFGFGTWVAYGEGRVIVGKAASGTFSTAGATGGAETHTLSTGEIPSHSHVMNTRSYLGSGGGTSANLTLGGGGYVSSNTDSTSSVGGGGAHNNLQPYIVAYMWNRTA